MEAIIYCRVSSDSGGRGRSVAEQERECRGICEREGWDVVDVLVDNDRGASRHSRAQRPEYERLADVLQPGMVLVTWEASRATRDLTVYARLRDLCSSRRVQMSYGGATYDLNTSDGRFTTGLHALLSENEAEKTRERVLRAFRHNAEEGKPHGKIPYGYKAKRDPDSGRIIARVPHPEQAAIVREAVHRIIAGETPWAVAQDFNARGVPTPGASAVWNGQRLSNVAKSPTHAGLRSHRGQITTGQWEPIISVDDHETVVALLNAPGRRTQRGTLPKHLLSGIAVCGVCGSVVERIKNSGYDSYTCSNPKRHVARRIPKVDALVERAVIAYCSAQSLPRDTSGTEAARAAQREVISLRTRLDAYIERAVAGSISPDAFEVIEPQLRAQLADAQRRAAPAVADPLITELLGANAERHWDAMTIVQKRRVIRELVTVRIMPASQGRTFVVEDIQISPTVR